MDVFRAMHVASSFNAGLRIGVVTGAAQVLFLGAVLVTEAEIGGLAYVPFIIGGCVAGASTNGGRAFLGYVGSLLLLATCLTVGVVLLDRDSDYLDDPAWLPVILILWGAAALSVVLPGIASYGVGRLARTLVRAAQGRLSTPRHSDPGDNGEPRDS